MPKCVTMLGVTKRINSRPQPTVCMRFPTEVVEYLDALVDHQRTSSGNTVHRADILVGLLRRAAIPANADAPTTRRLSALRNAAFPEQP